mgnify:CR=1 FL=1
MRVYEELKEIALMNEKTEELSEKVAEKIDAVCADFAFAKIVRGCEEKNGHLYNSDGKRLDNYGLVDDDYYCYQEQGYIEDDFYGRLYFATDEKGVFIEIPFSSC